MKPYSVGCWCIPFLIICIFAEAEGFINIPSNNNKNSMMLRVLIRRNHDRIMVSSLAAANKKDDNGYQFGDLTKRLVQNVGKKVSKDYEFGDLTKSVLGKATDAVTGNNENGDTTKDYQFGDLTNALDRKAKEKVSEFTNKDNYQVGDISKEIIRRAKSGEYKVDDIILLLKILMTVGMETMSPVAGALPAKLIFEMMNVSLGQEVGGRLLEVLAGVMDKRMKEAIVGDANYQVGDLTKKAILKFCDKDEYEFGDLSRAVANRANEKDTSGRIGMDKSNNKTKGALIMDAELISELDKWDQKLEIGKEAA